MQNKGFVKVFAVLLTIVCLFYLSFSVVTSYHAGKAEESGDSKHYMDSMQNKNVWLGIYRHSTDGSIRHSNVRNPAPQTRDSHTQSVWSHQPSDSNNAKPPIYVDNTMLLCSGSTGSMVYLRQMAATIRQPHSDAMVAVCLGIAYNNGGDTIVGDTTLVESLARKPRRCSEKVTTPKLHRDADKTPSRCSSACITREF